MIDERIEVKSYSGYRSDETPRSFTVGNKEIRVSAIVDIWVEEGSLDRMRKRFFKVKGSDGLIYRLFLDEATQEWFVRKRTAEIS